MIRLQSIERLVRLLLSLQLLSVGIFLQNVHHTASVTVSAVGAILFVTGTLGIRPLPWLASLWRRELLVRFFEIVR